MNEEVAEEINQSGTRSGKPADYQHMTNPMQSWAPDALATEYVRLYSLPGSQCGPEEVRGSEDIRARIETYGADECASYYEAAVRAIDPDEILGPYMGLGSEPMTPELFAFETWRLRSTYSSYEPVDGIDGSKTLGQMTRLRVVVSDPILRSFDTAGRQAWNTTQFLLVSREITAADFPDFNFRRYLTARGSDLAVWDASCALMADAEELMRGPSAS